MERSITLKAQELFYLGECMDAEYIDYAYVAAMPDIQKRYALHGQKALEVLEDTGVLEEDFSGSVEISEEVEELLRPVFFGDTESRLDNGEDHRVHILEGQMTLAKLEGDQITFCAVSESGLRELLRGDVLVQCSRAHKGFYEKAFSAEQLKDPDALREAIKILKGEIEYGIS